MSIAAHKFGGPTGVGALLLRRDTACVPLLHGGGQERDVRSGTPDVAGVVAMADGGPASPWTASRRTAERLRALRDRLIAGVLGVDRRRAAQRRARRAPAAGQRALHLPRLRRRLAADVVGRQRDRVLDRFGVYGRGRAALATCCWRWAPTRPSRADRCGCRWATPAPQSDVDAALRVLPAAVDRARAGRAGQFGAGRSAMRVLAAMSGGVDSSVAAARDGRRRPRGGRRAPGAVQRRRARCAPGRAAAAPRRTPATPGGSPMCSESLSTSGISPTSFKEDVIDDFVASYAARRDPQPVRALQREDQVLGAGGPGAGAGLRRRRHRPLRPAVGRRLRRAVDRDKDQSYVLGVLTADAVAARGCSRSATPPSRRSARRPPRAGSPVADKPDSHDICFIPSGDTQAFLGARIGMRRGTVVDAGRRRCWPNTTACTASPSASARAWASPAPDPTDGRATSPRSTPTPAPSGWAPPRTSTCGR